jgi:hypothetical protein
MKSVGLEVGKKSRISEHTKEAFQGLKRDKDRDLCVDPYRNEAWLGMT